MRGLRSEMLALTREETEQMILSRQSHDQTRATASWWAEKITDACVDNDWKSSIFFEKLVTYSLFPPLLQTLWL